jgi:hypothetical protein
VLALSAVTASAESQFEKLAKLTPSQKYILDPGFLGEISLRTDPNDALGGDKVKRDSEVTLKRIRWPSFAPTTSARAMFPRGFSLAGTPTLPLQRLCHFNHWSLQRAQAFRNRPAVRWP